MLLVLYGSYGYLRLIIKWPAPKICPFQICPSSAVVSFVNNPIFCSCVKACPLQTPSHPVKYLCTWHAANVFVCIFILLATEAMGFCESEKAFVFEVLITH